MGTLSHFILQLFLTFLVGLNLPRIHGQDLSRIERLPGHEFSNSIEETNAKIESVRKRRNWKAWDTTNPAVKTALSAATDIENSGKKRPNILMILADDLGYGDTSLPPFVKSRVENQPNWPCFEGGHLTPNLQRMADKGVIMTNFHSASPVCSPSRVAFLTSVFPSRLGALNAFELGHDLSQRNGYLPQVFHLLFFFIQLKVINIFYAFLFDSLLRFPTARRFCVRLGTTQRIRV
jgi:hypothetical protein